GGLPASGQASLELVERGSDLREAPLGLRLGLRASPLGGLLRLGPDALGPGLGLVDDLLGAPLRLLERGPHAVRHLVDQLLSVHAGEVTCSDRGAPPGRVHGPLWRPGSHSALHSPHSGARPPSLPLPPPRPLLG